MNASQPSIDNKNGVFRFRLIPVYLYIFMSYTSTALFQNDLLQQISLYAMLFLSVIYMSMTRHIKWNNYLSWYLGIFLLCAISVVYSVSKDYTINNLFTLVIPLILCFCITQVVVTNNDIKSIFITFSLSANILLLAILRNSSGIDGRVGRDLFGNENTFAIMGMLGLLCSIWLAFYSKNKWRVFYIFSVVAQFVLTSLSGGRKYIVIPFFFFFLLVYLSELSRKKKILFFSFLGICGVLALIAILTIPILFNTIGFRLVDSSQTSHSDFLRLLMVTSGLDYWLEAPFLGNGHHTFEYLFLINESLSYSYSHNNYVELLCNLGILGFVLYYSYYIYTLIKLRKKRNPYSSFFIAFILSFFVLEIGVVSYYGMTLCHLFLCLACISSYNDYLNTHNS